MWEKGIKLSFLPQKYELYTKLNLFGIQFGVSESTANELFNHWFPMLRELLPSSLLEQVKKTPVTLRLSKKYSGDLS